jgi:ribosomal protein S12 methylthiotransferase
VPARIKRQRRHALMARQRKIVARAHKARIGMHASVLIDGPSEEHEMVVQGRLEGQAPDIDSVVYLTDCDPTAYAPGTIVDTRVVDARGYDLVAAPIA